MTSPSRRRNAHSANCRPETATRAWDTSERPSVMATTAAAAATAGSNQEIDDGPVSGGTETTCHQPTPAATAPVIASTQATR